MQEQRFFDTQSFLAISLVLGILSLSFTMFFFPIPESDAFKMFLGGLMTVGFATVINFYFGSSKGSKEKDDAITQGAKAANETINAMVTGTGTGSSNSNGLPPGTTKILVTPPAPPDSTVVKTTVTDTTAAPDKPKGDI